MKMSDEVREAYVDALEYLYNLSRLSDGIFESFTPLPNGPCLGDEMTEELEEATKLLQEEGVVKIIEMTRATLAEEIPKDNEWWGEFLKVREHTPFWIGIINKTKFFEKLDEHQNFRKIAHEPEIDVRLVFKNKRLYLSSELGEKTVHNLRIASTVAFMDYIVNTRPNLEVSTSELSSKGILLSSSITETLRHLKLTKNLKTLFVPICTKDTVKIKDTARLTRDKVRKIYDSLG